MACTVRARLRQQTPSATWRIARLGAPPKRSKPGAGQHRQQSQADREIPPAPRSDGRLQGSRRMLRHQLPLHRGIAGAARTAALSGALLPPRNRKDSMPHPATRADEGKLGVRQIDRLGQGLRASDGNRKIELSKMPLHQFREVHASQKIAIQLDDQKTHRLGIRRRVISTRSRAPSGEITKSGRTSRAESR